MDDKIVLCIVVLALLGPFCIFAYFMGKASAEQKAKALENKIIALSREKTITMERLRTVIEAERALYERKIRELQDERDWNNGKKRGGDT